MAPRLNRAVLITAMLLSTAAFAEEPFRFKRSGDAVDQLTTPVYEIKPETGLDPGPAVSTQSLSALPTTGYGTIDEQGGGFAVDVWADTKADLVFDLANGLKTPPASPIKSLLVRLMKTQAYAPKEIEKVEPFIALKSDTLIKVGAVDDAADFLKNYKDTINSDSLLKNYTQTFFATAKVDEACIATATGLKQFSSVFWDRAKILCDILSDNKDGASLALKILQEKGNVSSTFDRMAAAALSGDTFVWLPKDSVGVLEAVLAGKLNLLAQLPTVEKGEMKYEDLGLYTILMSPAAGEAAKLEAGERLASVNYISPERLQQLYQSVTFTDEQLNAVAAGSEVKDDAYGRAALARAIMLAQTPADKIKLWSKFLQAMTARGLKLSAYSMGAGVFSGIAPATEYLPKIHDIVLSFLITGQDNLVAPWVDFVRAAPPVADTAVTEQAMVDIWPLIALQKVNSRDRTFASDANQWRALISQDRRDGMKDRYYAYAVILDAAGYALPPTIWDDLADVRKVSEVDFGVLHQLQQSIARKSLAILWLASLSHKAGDSVDMSAQLVRILKQAGFSKEAQEMAYVSLALAAK